MPGGARPSHFLELEATLSNELGQFRSTNGRRFAKPSGLNRI